ncbi:hypothetical protein D917_10391, partial [Trichinella nativa]
SASRTLRTLWCQKGQLRLPDGILKHEWRDQRKDKGGDDDERSFRFSGYLIPCNECTTHQRLAIWGEYVEDWCASGDDCAQKKIGMSSKPKARISLSWWAVRCKESELTSWGHSWKPDDEAAIY